MAAIGIVGAMVIGGMTKDMFWATIPVQIGEAVKGKDPTTIQSVLDGIMPGIVGMCAFWIYYWLLSKKINPMWLILGTMVLGVVGAFFGFLG
jgi:fructoselysine/glucoselysine PTS system EIID component